MVGYVVLANDMLVNFGTFYEILHVEEDKFIDSILLEFDEIVCVWFAMELES